MIVVMEDILMKMERNQKDYREMNDQLEAISDRLELTNETLRPLALKIRLLAKELRDTAYTAPPMPGPNGTCKLASNYAPSRHNGSHPQYEDCLRWKAEGLFAQSNLVL